MQKDVRLAENIWKVSQTHDLLFLLFGLTGKCRGIDIIYDPHRGTLVKLNVTTNFPEILGDPQADISVNDRQVAKLDKSILDSSFMLSSKQLRIGHSNTIVIALTETMAALSWTRNRFCMETVYASSVQESTLHHAFK